MIVLFLFGCLMGWLGSLWINSIKKDGVLKSNAFLLSFGFGIISVIVGFIISFVMYGSNHGAVFALGSVVVFYKGLKIKEVN